MTGTPESALRGDNILAVDFVVRSQRTRAVMDILGVIGD